MLDDDDEVTTNLASGIVHRLPFPRSRWQPQEGKLGVASVRELRTQDADGRRNRPCAICFGRRPAYTDCFSDSEEEEPSAAIVRPLI